MSIIVQNTDIRIRPSAVDGFFNCGYQWGKTFLEGISSIPNNRAAIGTSIHKAAEVYWLDAISTGKRDENLTKLQDAAVQEYAELAKQDLRFDEGENLTTSINTIKLGTNAFLNDIAPFAEIPVATEKYFEVPIVQHKLVTAVGGTIDYISKDTISDLKTSKRKPTIASYVTQQSIYRFLAESNGVPVKHNNIQSVVLKQKPDGAIYDLDPNVEQARFLINHILDILDIVAEDKVAPELILRGNPKYYLCSPKYCAHYDTCPFVANNVKATQNDVKMADNMIAQVKL